MFASMPVGWHPWWPQMDNWELFGSCLPVCLQEFCCLSTGTLLAVPFSQPCISVVQLPCRSFENALLILEPGIYVISLTIFFGYILFSLQNPFQFNRSFQGNDRGWQWIKVCNSAQQKLLQLTISKGMKFCHYFAVHAGFFWPGLEWRGSLLTWCPGTIIGKT